MKGRNCAPGARVGQRGEGQHEACLRFWVAFGEDFSSYEFAKREALLLRLFPSIRKRDYKS